MIPEGRRAPATGSTPRGSHADASGERAPIAPEVPPRGRPMGGAMPAPRLPHSGPLWGTGDAPRRTPRGDAVGPRRERRQIASGESENQETWRSVGCSPRTLREDGQWGLTIYFGHIPAHVVLPLICHL